MEVLSISRRTSTTKIAHREREMCVCVCVMVDYTNIGVARGAVGAPAPQGGEKN